jgi:hypothetical protein
MVPNLNTFSAPAFMAANEIKTAAAIKMSRKRFVRIVNPPFSNF